VEQNEMRRNIKTVHRQMRLRTKVFILMILFIGAISIFISIFFTRKLESQALDAVQTKARSIAEMTVFNVSPALYFGDVKTIEEAFESTKQNKELVYLVVVNQSGKVATAFHKAQADTANFFEAGIGVSADGNVYQYATPVLYDGHVIGRLYSGLSLAELKTQIQESRIVIFTVSLSIFAVGMLVVMAASLMITRPILRIIHTAEAVAKGNLKQRVAVTSGGEIGQLATSFNLMIERLDKAYTDLAAANRDLEYRVVKRTKALQQESIEHKQTAETLRKAEAQNKALLDAIPDMMFRFNKNGVYVGIHIPKDFGPTAPSGEAAEAALGKTLFEVLVPESARQFDDSIRNALRTNEMQVFEYQINLHGNIRDREARLVVSGEDEVLAIVRDITEEKQLMRDLVAAHEAAVEATRVKSQFLANMSHEIRTPMNGVVGMTGLLLETKLDVDQRDFVETIRVSGETLLTIINDILDFSKIESGRMDLEEQPFDVRACIEDTFDLFKAKALEKNIDLLYLVEPQVNQFVMGDVTRLRQILSNLVANALKFTNAGEVFVYVTKSAILDDPSASPEMFELRVAVRDTGIGIPEDKKYRLFKSFSQVDSSTTRKYGGTGLGLAISKRLAELMGGTMWAESTEGKGSTFFFTIRTKAADVAPKVFARTKVSELANQRVLIVDDNPTNRNILMLQCQHWGMIPKATETGEEALSWLSAGELFDVGILDMQMPDMDGIMLGKKIHELLSKNTFPLLMLTSSGRPDAAQELPEIFSALLPKPVKQAQLYDVLVGILFGGQRTISPNEFESKGTIDRTLAERLPLKILVAEDNAVNQKLARRILHQMGYEADMAASGLEAIEAMRQQPYNIIFMDLQMPDMDGLEATRFILDNWPAMQRPKIIAMTANAMQGDRERCLAAGMNDYISKPIRFVEMQDVLEHWGEISRREQLGASTDDLSVQPVANAGTSLIDRKTIAELRSLSANGSSFLRELTDSFYDEADNLLKEIKVATETQSLARLKDAAHNLKGASSGVGAAGMTRLCKELEGCVEQRSFSNVPELVARLEKSYELTRTELKEIL
jgi:signal transduction histidine kinase/DNA-binding response OmpR family regulator/HPt (histidine-containing phosphotransfer) domain-containing protein